MPTLNDAYNKLVDIYERFVDAANLEPQGQNATQALAKNPATAENLRRSNKSRPSSESWSSWVERIQLVVLIHATIQWNRSTTPSILAIHPVLFSIVKRKITPALECT
jgi:hypothetical protein